MISESFPPSSHLPPKEISRIKNVVRTEQAKKLYIQIMEDVENFPALMKAMKLENLPFEGIKKLENTLINPDNAKQRRESLKSEEPKLEARLVKWLEKTPYLEKIQNFFFETINSLLEAFGIIKYSQDSLNAEIHEDDDKQLNDQHLRQSYLHSPLQPELNKKTKKSPVEI